MKFGRISLIAALIMFVIAGLVTPVFATALSANRDTPQILNHLQVSLTVKNDEVIYAGSMVAVDSNGEAVSATDSASDQVVGRAAEYVDNSDDGETIKVDVGIFGWAKSGTISDAHIADIVYVVDDQTVATADPGNGCIAGIVVDQDSSYAYVDTSYLPRTAGTFTTLSASGAVTFGSTLAVTGNATFGGTVGITGNTTVGGTFGATGATTLGSTLVVTGVVSTVADVNNDATGGSAADPDFDVDGYARFNGIADMRSGQLWAYANKTANYTNSATDFALSYNTSAATTNTLPEASTVLGVPFLIALQDDDGDLVVVTDGTDTFDGTNNQITLADAGDSVLVVATAANVYTIMVNVGGTLATQ